MTAGIGVDPAAPGPFETALNRIVEPDLPVSGVRLAFLSDPSPADMTVFRSVWPAVPTGRRRAIARALLAAHESDFQVSFKPLFLALLDDADGEVRAAGVDGLAETGDVRLVARLVKMLRDDPEPLVRSRAADGLGTYVELGQLGRIEAGIARAALETVADAASDDGEETEVRRWATASAGFADYSEAGHLIESAIESGLTSMRIGALRAMGNSADERWELDVLAALSDALPEIRVEAARAAGSLSLGNAVPGLVALVDDVEPAVQAVAVWALGEIGGEVARGVLEAMLAETEDLELEEAIEDALACMTLSDGEMPWSELMDERTDGAFASAHPGEGQPRAGSRRARLVAEADADEAELEDDEDEDEDGDRIGVPRSTLGWPEVDDLDDDTDEFDGFDADLDDDTDEFDGFDADLDHDLGIGRGDDLDDDLEACSRDEPGADPDAGWVGDMGDGPQPRRRAGATRERRRPGWLTIRARPAFGSGQDGAIAEGERRTRESHGESGSAVGPS